MKIEQEAPSVSVGTRWNPTQQQIGILEMLYKRGMRTPNTQRIDQITHHLRNYGNIQGKNVFYWFQNHKARDRQKQKLALSPRASPSSLTIITPHDKSDDGAREEENRYKRKCAFECVHEEQESRRSRSCKDSEEHTTLELFPLHPQGR